ncbi:unnamed protein product [Urochloa humidicola]
MATTAHNGGEVSIAVEITEQADAVGDVVPPRENSEVQQSEREEQQQQRVISSSDMVTRKLKRLNMIVLCIVLLEWAGNAIGTLAFLWATVILLGGFSSFLNRTDFWFATVMIFMEGCRVFIRNDASVNQWLFGSTRAFIWENFSFSRMVRPKHGNLIAVIIGVGISLKISFYMLFSVIVGVLIANLQIPMAFLQALLSILRLLNLLGHHHHRDYHPLPPDASPKLVPSIAIFFMLELCQGLSYIVAVILGLISFLHRRSLVHVLEFKEEWGAKAVNLYHHQAYQAL